MTLDARIRRVERAVLFVEGRLFEPLTAPDIAKAAGGSVSELHRVFRDVYGTPLMAYVRARRLTEAARMLVTHPDWEAGEIGLRAGYGSQAAFTRAFRDRFGMTPGAFRIRRPVSYRRVEPASVSILTHRDRLVPTPSLRWVHRDLHLSGTVSTVDGMDPEGFLAPARALHQAVGDQPAVGLLMSSDSPGGLRYFLGVEGASGGPEQAVFQAGLYAVFAHDGPTDRIRDSLAFLSEVWDVDLLSVASRPHAERFALADVLTPTPRLTFWLAVEPDAG